MMAMGGDAESRTKARAGNTRRVVADRVEALTQPVPGHELADVRFERRTAIGPRSARVMVMVVAALVVVVGGVMLINEMTGDAGGSGERGDVVAGLSPEVSGEAGVETAGDTGGPGDTGEQDGDDGTGYAEDPQGADAGPFIVSVQGLVHRPGLLTVDPGVRVGEVIDRSGGVRADGRLEGVNLAEQVVDGLQIVVDADGSQVVYPGQAPEAQAQEQSIPGGGAGTGGGNSAAGGADGTVNLNTADATILTTLSGVGPATAESILAWREANGPFTATEQLLQVKGIGPAKFEALRDSVTV